MTSSAASFPRERHAGVLLPLFAAASDEGWGIGEIPDLVTLAAWHRRAGLDFLLMLPVNELAPSGHHSPYATVSAMAIDPIYLRLADVPDFAAAGGVERLSAEQRDRLAAVRQSPQVDYDAVREVKQAALRAAFDRFEHGRGRRARRARRRVRQLHAARGRLARRLRAVPRAARSLRVAALVGVARRPEHAPAVGADRGPAQPEARDPLPRLPAVARRRRSGRRRGPTAGDPAVRRPAVHGRRRQRRRLGSTRRSSTSTPRSACRPTRSAPTGQDWGLPAYRWDVVERDDFALAARPRAPRHRALRRLSASITSSASIAPTCADATARRPLHARGSEAQKALGERIMQVFRASRRRDHRRGPRAPCPTSSASRWRELGVPGYKVFRWERDWKRRAAVPRSAALRRVSVATTGTHDTETLAEWWDTAPPDERTDGRCRCRDLAARRLSRRTRRSTTRCATRCWRTIYRLGLEPAWCCRCRTSSAGAIASTSPAPSATRTGRGGCRSRSATC